MIRTARAKPSRPPRSLVVVVVVPLVAVVLAVALAGSIGARSSSATPAAIPPRSGLETTSLPGDEGSLTDGATVFDDSSAAVARLDSTLLAALRQAATDAARDGIVFQVNSGWRSAEYQERLLQEAVAAYGSAEEAARWVATPSTSPHVRGEAVDLGGWDATEWLSEHGAAYGLCPVYANEPWHYELRPDAVEHGCPELYADPTEDPRMQG
ncbi:M15 family metallopeptidase [Agromyces sp. ZXT2-3]|uniref:M15 family metallopeptidase n=1 Tax=Agromyces sp. ZXT2-3 TaxID=3461152 RepID=UPI00405510F7